MSFPFGGHPTLAEYIDWIRREHGGEAKSGFATGSDGGAHALTKITLPNNKSVVVVGCKQTERLVPSTVGYLDRRLGVTSPWFKLPEWESQQ